MGHMEHRQLLFFLFCSTLLVYSVFPSAITEKMLHLQKIHTLGTLRNVWMNNWSTSLAKTFKSNLGHKVIFFLGTARCLHLLIFHKTFTVHLFEDEE
jgi:hypothetical protein